MIGADEYADLFDGPEQFDRLLVLPGRHARGKTFRIFVLPDDKVIYGHEIYNVRDAVEVFGITGGQPGWTETYGWIHEGQWQLDFSSLVAERKRNKWEATKKNARDKKRKEKIEAERVQELLTNYSKSKETK